MPSQSLIGQQTSLCQVTLIIHGVFIPRTSAVDEHPLGDVAKPRTMTFQSVGYMKAVIEVGQRVICLRS